MIFYHRKHDHQILMPVGRDWLIDVVMTFSFGDFCDVTNHYWQIRKKLMLSLNFEPKFSKKNLWRQRFFLLLTLLYRGNLPLPVKVPIECHAIKRQIVWLLIYKYGIGSFECFVREKRRHRFRNIKLNKIFTNRYRRLIKVNKHKDKLCIMIN